MAVIPYDTYRDTCNAIRYVSRYIDTDTATLSSTIPLVYIDKKFALFFYCICKSLNIFVTDFGKFTINLTFMLYTEFTCLCVVEHVIHTIKTSKHEESTVLMDRSPQVLCSMQPVFHGAAAKP